VPRHRFVPSEHQDRAYADHPLSIGHGQTISQPYIVAFMTQAARPGAGDRCLEIGTGSGYQAAVLAELCDRTYSIEVLAEVARSGERNLRDLGYGPDRVWLRVGNGYGGWPQAAPFQVILVTAAPEQVPGPLLDQLAVGGRLVVPVGPEDGDQELERWTRIGPGSGRAAFRVERLLPVRFVPFRAPE
jgi:protein-L-isoaspartate(D-aspartate) O-methyltransferase